MSSNQTGIVLFLPPWLGIIGTFCISSSSSVLLILPALVRVDADPMLAVTPQLRPTNTTV